MINSSATTTTSTTATATTNNRSRVKLYTLNEERQWDDRGTGFVTCTPPTAANNNHSLIVKSEVDGSSLLDSKILLHTKYQKQQVRRISFKSSFSLIIPFRKH